MDSGYIQEFPVDEHPETTCDRCGGPNLPSWWVDSDRFNAAMEAIGLHRGVIVCPQCFVEGHEKATGMTTSWELRPSTPFRPNDRKLP